MTDQLLGVVHHLLRDAHRRGDGLGVGVGVVSVSVFGPVIYAAL
jgi:hypothetical protein